MTRPMQHPGASDVEAGGRAPPINPSRCPDCAATLVVIDGVGTCRRCGYSGGHPLARRVWEIDNDLARLGWERAHLIDRMRRDRCGPPPSPPMPPAPPVTIAAGRSLSVQAVLVGLGAFLVIVAAVIFAVVTWEQLGAAGQAAVLVLATVTATAITVVAARAGLSATAEAVAVVAAGFGFIDIHAVRTAVAPGGEWQLAWAVGITVVAAGLVALGRAARLRGPAIVAVGSAQLPLVFLASMASPAGLGIATALVATSAVDLALGRALAADPVDWLPAPVPVALLVIGVFTWAVGTIAATPWAVGSPSTSEVLWGVGILVGATAVAGHESWTDRERKPLAVLAAAGAVLSGLAAVLGAGGAVIEDGYALLLVANASAVAVLAGSLIAVGGTVGVERHATVSEQETAGAGADPRILAVQCAAGGWAALSLAGWIEPVLGSIVAPFALIADQGWWDHGVAIRTGDLDLGVIDDVQEVGGPAVGLVLGAVAIGTAALVLVVRLVGDRIPAVRSWGTAAAIGIGLFIAIAVAGAMGDVPVLLLVVAYLVAAAALSLAPVAPRAFARPWLAVPAVPIAASAVAWAGTVDVFTVAALTFLTIVGAVSVTRGLLQERRTWTAVWTALTGIALATTALTMALAVGAGAPGAWIAALAAAAAGSGFAWIGDRRAPWWSPAVDVTSAVTVGGALFGLADAGGPDPFSVGLLLVLTTAAAHATRPDRRVIGVAIAGVAALALWWLRLWEADVRVVEAYSLPAAVLAGGAGWWRMRQHPDLGSWPALGPALLVAAVPSTSVAIAESAVLRPLVVLGGAVAVTLAGARWRLRALLAVGSITAVIIAVDQLFPVVARLPRWIGIGTAGIVLLVVGATFERQRRRVVGVLERYRELR